jgi:hypothetical protein
MKKIIFYTLTILVFASCSSTIKLTEVPIEKNYGVQTISIEEGEAKGKITYNGDYWFHDFDDDLYPTVSEPYLKYLSKLTKKDNAKMLWAAHTTVLPYIASTALVYDEAKKIDGFQEDLRTDLRKKHNATAVENQSFGTKAGEFQRLSYLIYDDETRIQTQHIEYIGVIKNKTFRIIFWTSDSNILVLNNETDRIMQTLSVQWY